MKRRVGENEMHRESALAESRTSSISEDGLGALIADM